MLRRKPQADQRTEPRNSPTDSQAGLVGAVASSPAPTLGQQLSFGQGGLGGEVGEERDPISPARIPRRGSDNSPCPSFRSRIGEPPQQKPAIGPLSFKNTCLFHRPGCGVFATTTAATTPERQQGA